MNDDDPGNTNGALAAAHTSQALADAAPPAIKADAAADDDVAGDPVGDPQLHERMIITHAAPEGIQARDSGLQG